VLTTFGLVGVGCSSNSSAPAAGGAAATTGGTAGTTGGAGTHTGGAAGTTGGAATGTGGAGTTNSCSGKTNPAPTNGVIADFVGTAADAGIEIVGGISTYGTAGVPTSTPTYTISGGALKITENADATAAAQYVGTVLYFNNCVDAHAFSGIEFTVGGTVSGCTVQYSANYTGADATATDPKGSCTLASCYSPQKTLTIPATPTQMQIAWADTGTNGSPVGPVDPTALTSTQWQFTIPAAGTSPCTANLTITNVKFY
jgi:hypothetical protein